MGRFPTSRVSTPRVRYRCRTAPAAEFRVVCGRGRDPTVSVSRCRTGSAPGQRYSPGQVDVLPAERRETVRQGLTARRRRRRLVGRTRDVGQEFARPRASAGRGRRRPGQRPRPARRFPSASPHRPAPRRPDGAGPLVQSEPALGEPVVRTGRSRREPTAAPFGCRRSGATAPARRRRRGTRPAGGTTPPPSPRGGDQGQLRGAGPEGPRILKPEDRDAGRAKRRISPPPANNPRMLASNSSSLSREKRSTSRRQRMTSCTTMISAFRRAGALPVVIACAWAETNVYQPAWAASLSSFFARSLSRLSCPGSNRSSSSWPERA